MKKKLAESNALSGFFSLIVDAAQAWYRDGLLESNVKLSVVLDSLKKFLADVTFFLREDVPSIFVGSCPTDGRNFLLTAEEYKDFIKYESDVAKLIRNYVGSNELINGITRYCLWLKDCPLVMKRVEGVPSKTNTSS